MHDHTSGSMISKITESQMEHCRIDYYLTKITLLGERGMFLSFENIPRVLLISEINHASFYITLLLLPKQFNYVAVAIWEETELSK